MPESKCYFVSNGAGVMMLGTYGDSEIQMNNLVDSGKTHKTVQDAFSKELYRLERVYVFDTRKELYQWLAED